MCVTLVQSLSYVWLFCDHMDCSLLARLLCPWDFPGNLGDFYRIFPTQRFNPSLLYCRWILSCWGTWEAHENLDLGWILGLGRSPEEGNVNPLQYSCLGNSGQRSMAGYSPWGLKSGAWLRSKPSSSPPPPHTHTHTHTKIDKADKIQKNGCQCEQILVYVFSLKLNSNRIEKYILIE